MLAVKQGPPVLVSSPWAGETKRNDLGYPSPQPGRLGSGGAVCVRKEALRDMV